MKKRILFNISYFLLWIFYFVIARILFLAFYFDKTTEVGFTDTLKAFFYGLRLDASFAAYLSIIPFLVILFSVFISNKIVTKILKAYTFLTLVTFTLLITIDLGLYKSWGVRIDSTLLNYLETPEIMWATTSTKQLILGVLFWLFFTILFYSQFKKLISKTVFSFKKGKIFYTLPLLFLTVALLLPIRGGVQEIPINQSNVYFSDKMFANHAAINCIWNFSHSFSHKVDKENPYIFFDSKVADNIISKRRKNLTERANSELFNNENPNIILIIWESLTGKFVGSIGGEPDVTENLNKLSKEGILFTNFYSNGDRTDKGLVSILSGYYPQTDKSIIKIPNKAKSLPTLTQSLINKGYTTSFYYGGDLNFGNMNTYLRNSGVKNLVDGSRFNKEDWNSKWGAHDHIFLDSLSRDLSKKQIEPFFTTALTLTSHEPFEIPHEYKFGNDSDINKFRSSHAYTDKAIGRFIEFAKTQPWWNNTVVIIMADHGHWMPEQKGFFHSKEKFKIPMLWLGGALKKKDTIINSISSHSDFTYTLLKSLKKDDEAEKFVWGNNIFNNNENQYVHYIFNKGYGTFDKNGEVAYDFTGKKRVVNKGENLEKLDSLGKALTQKAYQDFIDR